jgi:selenocysteine lyase/cysteine desulfurase
VFEVNVTKNISSPISEKFKNAALKSMLIYRNIPSCRMHHQKDLVHLDPNIHYLNCASKSPLLLSAERAMQDALEREKNIHLRTSAHFFERLTEAQSLFSDLVNCRPSQVAFMPAVSYGLSSVLNNVKGKKGQHAITIESEFPSDYLALDRWCQTYDSTLKVVGQNSDSKGWNELVLDAIDKDTAVVAISAIHWISGYKYDLEAIGQRCEDVGAVFVVDGTQAVGAMHIDVKAAKIDALICAGYKWLFGPYSIGCFYMSERFNNGVPIEESWMNRTNASKFSELTNYGMEYTPDAGRYSVGETSNFLLMPVFIEGLKQVTAWGPANIQAYCEDLVKPLHTVIDQNGLALEKKENMSSHLFSLKVPSNVSSDDFIQSLSDKNIYASARGSGMRVSFNVFNTEEDVAALISVLS